MTISQVLNEYFLIETIVKAEGGFKIKREDGKLLPKIYKSKRAAARIILIMKSKGGFARFSKDKQKQMITNYLKKHKL